jgi:hypothetical protein
MVDACKENASKKCLFFFWVVSAIGVCSKCEGFEKYF